MIFSLFGIEQTRCFTAVWTLQRVHSSKKAERHCT